MLTADDLLHPLPETAKGDGAVSLESSSKPSAAPPLLHTTTPSAVGVKGIEPCLTSCSTGSSVWRMFFCMSSRGPGLWAALWNRNYFFRFRTFEKLWFRFLLLKVTVPVPVPAPYLDHKKQIFQKKNFGNFFVFLLCKLYKKVNVYKFQQIYCKM
jgi:hypothetical protein